MPAVWPYREKLPEPPRRVTCEKCGSKFLVKAQGRGRLKYCVECRVNALNECHRKQKRKAKDESQDKVLPLL